MKGKKRFQTKERTVSTLHRCVSLLTGTFLAIFLCTVAQGACSGGPIKHNETFYCEIETAADFDYFYFSGEAGDRVTITMHETEDSLYPRIDIFDPDGSYRSGDSHPVHAQVRDYTLQKTGEYTIRTSDNGDNATGSYWVHLDLQ